MLLPTEICGFEKPSSFFSAISRTSSAVACRMFPSSPRELGTIPSYLIARAIDFSKGHAATTQSGIRGCCLGRGG